MRPVQSEDCALIAVNRNPDGVNCPGDHPLQTAVARAFCTTATDIPRRGRLTDRCSGENGYAGLP